MERPSTVWLVAAGLMVAAYILVNVLYGLSTARPALPVINEPDHVVVYVNPVSVVPAGGQGPHQGDGGSARQPAQRRQVEQEAVRGL